MKRINTYPSSDERAIGTLGSVETIDNTTVILHLTLTLWPNGIPERLRNKSASFPSPVMVDDEEENTSFQQWSIT